jgi:hypothetical protein
MKPADTPPITTMSISDMDMGGTRQSGHFVSAGKSENLANASFSLGCSRTGRQLPADAMKVSPGLTCKQKGSLNVQDVSLALFQMQTFAIPV